MRELFLWLLRASISAGWLVLLIAGLRLLLRRWPKWVFPALWSLVGIRLLLPVKLISRYSLVPQLSLAGVTVTEKADTAFSGGSLLSIGSVIWAVVAALLLLYSLISFLLLRRKLRTAVRLEGMVYQSEYVRSPFILGILSPRIYLPFHLSSEEASHIIAHELAHIRRRDHWWKPIAYAVLCVYWFHPLFWLAFIFLCKDIELACDERVVRSMTESERAAYAQTLLTCTVNQFPVSACPLSFGSGGINRRIHSVLSYKKPGRFAPIAAASLMLVLSLCFLTDPAAPKTSDTFPPSQSQLSASEQTERPSPTQAQSPDPEAPNEVWQARMDAEVRMIAERILQQEQALRMPEMQARADQLIAEKFPAMKWPENSVVLSAEQAKQSPLCDTYPELRDAQIVFLVAENSDLPLIVVVNNSLG